MSESRFPILFSLCASFGHSRAAAKGGLASEGLRGKYGCDSLAVRCCNCVRRSSKTAGCAAGNNQAGPGVPSGTCMEAAVFDGPARWGCEKDDVPEDGEEPPNEQRDPSPDPAGLQASSERQDPTDSCLQLLKAEGSRPHEA